MNALNQLIANIENDIMKGDYHIATAVLKTTLNLYRVYILQFDTETQKEFLRVPYENHTGYVLRCIYTGLPPIGAGGSYPEIRDGRIMFYADWRGLVELAKKTGKIWHAYAAIVRERDECTYEIGDNPRIAHHINLKQQDRGKIIGAYAVLILRDEKKHIEYMDITELKKVEACTRGKSRAWADWQEELMKKTVIRRALKCVTSFDTSELATALTFDNENYDLNRAHIQATQKEEMPIVPPSEMTNNQTTQKEEAQTPPPVEVKNVSTTQENAEVKKETTEKKQTVMPPTKNKQDEHKQRMISEIIEIARNAVSIDAEVYDSETTVEAYLKKWSEFVTATGEKKYIEHPEQLEKISVAWLQKIYKNARDEEVQQ